MKILITTDWYTPAINGVVTSVLNLTKGLRALGCDVRILTLSYDSHTHRDGIVTYAGSVTMDKVYPNARARFLPYDPALNEIKKWKPDVVHSQCEFSTYPMARNIAKACNAALVHTYHTMYEDYSKYLIPIESLGRSVAVGLTKKFLKYPDRVIVPSEKIKRLLLNYGIKTPIDVVPSGLDLEKYEKPLSSERRAELRADYGLSADETVLLYLGRIAFEKNLDEIIEYSMRYSGNHKFLIVGDGPYRQELERKLSKYGDRVIFTGMVSPNDVPDYYRLGDIFLSASQTETQGLTFYEAMACGLPLLCKWDTCLNGVVDNGVNGYVYASETEFAGYMERLLKDDALRLKMAEAAKSTAFSRFSSEAFAASAMEVYRRALADKSSGKKGK
ncbi:MAG: glycosyltransferase family 4 protein [Eubacteriales bacterium]|nr:glycosyltransferase family 4 protein [Eubacteriales bacterium]